MLETVERIIYFDEQAVTNASASALEKRLWERFSTFNSPENDKEFLLKLRFLTKDEDGNVYPTVSSVLMTSDQPQAYLPGAFIQEVAYRGEEIKQHITI